MVANAVAIGAAILSNFDHNPTEIQPDCGRKLVGFQLEFSHDPAGLQVRSNHGRNSANLRNDEWERRGEEGTVRMWLLFIPRIRTNTHNSG